VKQEEANGEGKNLGSAPGGLEVKAEAGEVFFEAIGVVGAGFSGA
jgi:hypothetical protein